MACEDTSSPIEAKAINIPYDMYLETLPVHGKDAECPFWILPRKAMH